MQLFVHSRPSASALWIVSDGDNTVGPIRTELLLRGVKHGRVGSDEWRRLDQVREIAGLNGQAGSIQDFELASRDLMEARDEREVLLLLLHGSAVATRACHNVPPSPTSNASSAAAAALTPTRWRRTNLRAR